jgi:hypothetical protein
MPSKTQRKARHGASKPMAKDSLLKDLRPHLKDLTMEELTDLVLRMRKRGQCCAEIADAIYTSGMLGLNRVHQFLSTAPRRWRFGREIHGPAIGSGLMQGEL